MPPPPFVHSHTQTTPLSSTCTPTLTPTQSEQQARLEAQLDLNRQKKRVAALEAEVTQQRNAYNQVCVLWYVFDCGAGCTWGRECLVMQRGRVGQQGQYGRSSLVVRQG